MSRRIAEPLALAGGALGALWLVPELTLVWLVVAVASIGALPLRSAGRLVVAGVAAAALVGLAVAAEGARAERMEWGDVPTDRGVAGTFTASAPGYNGPVRLRLIRDEKGERWETVESMECAVWRPRGADGISGATQSEIATRRALTEAKRQSFAAMPDSGVPRPGLLARIEIRPLERDGAIRLALATMLGAVLVAAASRARSAEVTR